MCVDVGLLYSLLRVLACCSSCNQIAFALSV